MSQPIINLKINESNEIKKNDKSDVHKSIQMCQSDDKFNELLWVCKKYDDSHVYKPCRDCYRRRSYFVILKKLHDTITDEGRNDVNDDTFAEFLADKLFVVKIIDLFDLNITINHVTCVNMLCLDGVHKSISGFVPIEMIYEVGKIAEHVSYDTNVDGIKSRGIYYYRTPLPAFYRAIDRYIYTGELIEWHANGMEAKRCNYIKGQLSGKCTIQHMTGHIQEDYYGDLSKDEQKNEKRGYCDGGDVNAGHDACKNCRYYELCHSCKFRTVFKCMSYREVCHVCRRYTDRGGKEKIM